MTDSALPVVVMRPAVSLADFLYCRRLRNEVRLNMTGDTEPISLFRQLKFYLSRPAGIDIYIAWVEGRRAGYLLLRPQQGSTLITEAIDGAFRRRGIGAAMIRFALAHHADLTADILNSNTASVALHRSCGFVFVSEAKGVSTYRLARPSVLPGSQQTL